MHFYLIWISFSCIDQEKITSHEHAVQLFLDRHPEKRRILAYLPLINLCVVWDLSRNSPYLVSFSIRVFVIQNFDSRSQTFWWKVAVSLRHGKIGMSHQFFYLAELTPPSTSHDANVCRSVWKQTRKRGSSMPWLNISSAIRRKVLDTLSSLFPLASRKNQPWTVHGGLRPLWPGWS